MSSSGSFFPDLPSRLSGPLVETNLPREFAAESAVDAWLESSGGKAYISAVRFGSREGKVIALPAFSGRRTVFLVVLARGESDLKVVYANDYGVDLSAMVGSAFRAHYTEDQMLELMEGQILVATVDFRGIQRAIEKAFR